MSLDFDPKYDLLAAPVPIKLTEEPSVSINNALSPPKTPFDQTSLKDLLSNQVGYQKQEGLFPAKNDFATINT